ncbi:MAG: hypothetical protein VZR24_21020 [Butyrivibrio hungatei]|nr:hypothetical protein [Butyrivibrio hungatei]
MFTNDSRKEEMFSRKEERGKIFEEGGKRKEEGGDVFEEGGKRKEEGEYSKHRIVLGMAEGGVDLGDL